MKDIKDYQKELINKRFTRLKVKEVWIENNDVMCKCKCDCGNIVSVFGNNLGRGNTMSCGCLNKEKIHERCFKDLTGMTFDRLHVDRLYTGPNHLKYSGILWECTCSCGNTCIVQTNNLLNGHTRSCGCLARDVTTTHGLTKTKEGKRLIGIYNAMKARCYRPSCNGYEKYGGRGITICDEWTSKPGDPMNTGFINFYNWAISNGYKDKLTLDRLNNDKGYSPDNCRWATPLEQGNNKTNNKYITDVNGETFTYADFERKHHLSPSTVSKWARSRTLNEIVFSVNHPEYGMYYFNKKFIDKDGFQHMIPKYNKERYNGS